MSDESFRECFSSSPYDRGHLITEQNNLRSHNLDTLNTTQLVQLFNDEDIQPQIAVSNALPQISIAVEKILERVKKGGRIFYLGAGTSGRLGVLDAAECPPTFCTPPDLVQGVLAGGEPSLIKSSEGLEDLQELGMEDLKLRTFCEKDCLIAISAGGTTPYFNGALEFSRSINALSIAITCIPDNQLSIDSDVVIRLITGPELISGSTRLKAGTATKMTLNIISSVVMIRLGKVYGNSMVDLSATNKKLVDRSLRILNQIAGLSRNEALHILKKANGSVKASILMALSGLNFRDSKKLLSKNQNHLRQAINEINPSLNPF